MRKFKLKNGLTVVWEPRKSDTVAFEISVGTGSNNESKNIAGMSHFLEHMIFEGTKTRSAKEISETIENVGGELNAATSHERTFFYIKLPRKKSALGLDILSDIINNPTFTEKTLEKERKVILEEIKMVTDQPLLYQWVLFQKTLFKRHPTKNPIFGRFDSVKKISRKQMVNYYRKYYTPNNMTLCVVGDSKDLLKTIKEHFGDLKPKKVPAMRKVKEPAEKKPTIKKEKRDTNQAYLLLGYKTIPRKNKESFVFDVISSIFSKGLSGRINQEIRIKRGLAYSVGASHESKKDYGFFVFHLNCNKKNVDLCKRIILDEINKLSNITKKELDEAKEHIIGHTTLDSENSQKRADALAFWEFIKDAKLADLYRKNIKKVTKKDITRVRNKFLDKNYTMVVLSK
jgi:predicted Zn-dependent peptidase